MYIAVPQNFYPLVYDSYKDEWSTLPPLPYLRFSLAVVPHKKQLLAIGGKSGMGIRSKIFAWSEDSKKWTTPYPDMPTARCQSSSISHGSAVIVAGGVTKLTPWTITGVVEVLHIPERSSSSSKPHWSVVEQLPYAIYEAVPLIIYENLYIAEGYDGDRENTCNIVTASLPELLQSKGKRATLGKVWKWLPDMPHSSSSITRYQDCLVIFNGDRKVELSGEEKYDLVKQSYLYNPNTNSWDYVGDDFHDYKLGKAVNLRESKIVFVGGTTGTFNASKDDDLVATCTVLKLKPY